MLALNCVACVNRFGNCGILDPRMTRGRHFWELEGGISQPWGLRMSELHCQIEHTRGNSFFKEITRISLVEFVGMHLNAQLS